MEATPLGNISNLLDVYTDTALIVMASTPSTSCLILLLHVPPLYEITNIFANNALTLLITFLLALETIRPGGKMIKLSSSRLQVQAVGSTAGRGGEGVGRGVG